MTDAPLPRSRRRLFAVLAVLLPLLLLEGAGRLAWPLLLRTFPLPLGRYHWEVGHEDDPRLLWRMKANLHLQDVWPGVDLDTNSLGLRDDEVTTPKPAGLFRILSLGESTAFGHGIPAAECYASVLENTLGIMDDTHRYEVVNAGMRAWSSFQSLIWLEEEGMELEPDLVLWYHEGNDSLPTVWRNADDTSVGMGLTDARLQQRRLRFAGCLTLLNRSAFYRSLKLLLLRTGKKMPSAADRSPDPGTTGERAGVRVPPEDLAWIYPKLYDMTVGAGIPLVILHPCYRLSMREHHLTCPLANFISRYHLPEVNVIRLFDDTGRPREELFLDPGHPTPEGHLMIAIAVRNRLIRERLLPWQVEEIP